MPCFHPRDIVVNKRKVVYKWKELSNGKVVRERGIDGKPIVLAVLDKYTVQVPCGHCAACLALQQSQWSFRIEQEALYGGHVCCLFVTFTYDNEHLPEDCCLSKSVVQRYLHDLRQNLSRTYKSGASKESVPSVKYYFCGEYGSKFGRPHYHAILFFDKSFDWRIIQKSWSKGIVDIRPFTPARAGYVAKYSVKDLSLDYAGRTAPFHLQSKGLGSCFLDTYKSFSALSFNTYFRNSSGRKVKLPRYYLDKLGTKRSYLNINLSEIGAIRRVSFMYHTSGYIRTNEIARLRFLRTDSLNRKLSGLDFSRFELKKREESIKLEHELSVLKKRIHPYFIAEQYEKFRFASESV